MHFQGEMVHFFPHKRGAEKRKCYFFINDTFFPRNLTLYHFFAQNFITDRINSIFKVKKIQKQYSLDEKEEKILETRSYIFSFENYFSCF